VSKKTDVKQQLDSARADLAAAQATLNAVLERELASTDTAASFDAWRRERDSAVSEVERLSKRIERLESAANDEAVNAQQAALRKRVDAQRQANQMLAQRIREEGGLAIQTLLKLAHDVAAAEIVDAELNAQIARRR
jgi:hypothetical protein